MADSVLSNWDVLIFHHTNLTRFATTQLCPLLTFPRGWNKNFNHTEFFLYHKQTHVCGWKSYFEWCEVCDTAGAGSFRPPTLNCNRPKVGIFRTVHVRTTILMDLYRRGLQIDDMNLCSKGGSITTTSHKFSTLLDILGNSSSLFASRLLCISKTRKIEVSNLL